MDYTYLDYFNYYLKEFLNEIIANYPETQVNILANYRTFLEGKDNKNDMYVKYFYTKINNSLQQIAHKDETLFTSSTLFLEGVDFSTIWNSSLTTEKTKKAIWKYLQILMIIGRKVIPNHKEILEILNKISNGEISAPAKVEKTLAADKDDDEDKPSSVFGLGDVATSLGSLGGLAGGLSSMLGSGGLSSMLGGAGGGGEGLGNLISSFSSMLNNPEFTSAMSQLSQQVADGLPTQSDNTENSTDENHTNEYITESTTENTETTQETTDTTSETTSQQPLFNTPLFGDLAKEIASTFNFDEMNQGEQPANIGEALGKFMSGNNPAKLMNLVGKFGSRLQDEVKSGRLNPADLLKQTMGAAGGSMPETLQRAAEAMASNPQLRRAAQQQSTRDRLRAKLDKKRQENGSQ